MSIVTNPALTSALSLLRAAQSEHRKTLEQISTGREVNAAADNAAYWAIARMMGAHSSALAAGQDAIGVSRAVADIATAGLKTAGGIVTEIRSKIVMAGTMTSGRDTLNDEINQFKEQLRNLTSAASFAGLNWLETGPAERPGLQSLVTGLSEGPDGPVIETLEHDTTGGVLVARGDAGDGLLTRPTPTMLPSGATASFHLLDAGSAVPAAGSQSIALSDATSTDDLMGMVGALDSMLSDITGAAARTGVTSARLAERDDFLSRLTDSLAGGMGGLIDADLGETAIKLHAAELQAKLQVVVLNMVNENSRTLLGLFR